MAQQLGADLLVEGSVQTENGQVRAVAKLIEPYQDGHLWVRQFDRPMDDIQALQQEISAAITFQISNAARSMIQGRIKAIFPEIHRY